MLCLEKALELRWKNRTFSGCKPIVNNRRNAVIEHVFLPLPASIISILECLTLILLCFNLRIVY